MRYAVSPAGGVERGGHGGFNPAPGVGVGNDDLANAAAGALVAAGEGPASHPYDPNDDAPFDAWSPEAVRLEMDRGRRVRSRRPEREIPPEALT